MAVDYTKVFTLLGKYVDKVIDYYAFIGTFNTDQAAIESTLSAQSVVGLVDGLDEMYDSFRGEVSAWVTDLIGRMSEILTDETLVASQFGLGSQGSLNAILPLLIRDMAATDKNVTANVSTIGSVTDVYRANALSGKVVVGSKLDGVTPPMNGALAVRSYAGLTTQLTPDDETLTFTCVDDSEHGTIRGSEVFQITGTGPLSGPYSPDGESVGSLGSIVVADNQASDWASNTNLDSWSGTPEVPDSWEVSVGTAGTDFVKGSSSETLYGTGNSLKTADTVSIFQLDQVLDSSRFPRGKTYHLSFWARKAADTLLDASIGVSVFHDSSLIDLIGTPTGITWTNYSGQFLIPEEITESLVLSIGASLDSTTHNHIIIDQIVIVPCVYHAGVSPVIFGGTDKFLIGDTFTCAISNDNAGKFQTAFRKAFRVQLPTDATPTISDALVA